MITILKYLEPPIAVEHFFLYNNDVHKIQTIFTTNKIKKNNYNKTWDYTNTHNH